MENLKLMNKFLKIQILCKTATLQILFIKNKKLKKIKKTNFLI